MIRGLKWILAFWTIRNDRRIGRVIAAVRILSWQQRASLVVGLARDPRIPRRVRFAPLLLAAYIAAPLDLIPDFIPVLGRVDDLAVMSLILRFMQRSLPPGLLEEHLRRVTGEAPS
jgi:uncharacterized membrane protein YkvA (DUF1232 family)